MRVQKHLKQRILLFLFFACSITISLPIKAHAEEKTKVIRIGWFESTFCYRDSFGRRCGIDYEYQHKISAYTGWTYEYVEDSWPNLFQKLMAGEIDMLSDVSYTEERTESMLFPDLPMGTESYYIYIDADNRTITAEDLSTFNGTKIGVNKGSVQEGFLAGWIEKNNLNVEIVPLVDEEEASMGMIDTGEIDGYASTNTFGAKGKVAPACRIGSSDYYYAVNKNRPDLLAELNYALAAIQNEDPYFNTRMSEEHLYTTNTNAFLTSSQEDWLKEHGTIRVGYRQDFLPFCQTDKATGEMTGALKDYLAHAAYSLKNSDIQFETIPYASTESALEAMKAGKIDCVFPVYLSSYDSNETGVRLTSPAMTTEVNTVMRVANDQALSQESEVVFAVNAGDVNTRTFIMEHYPASSIVTCKNNAEGFDLVSSKKADCVLVSNYRLPAADEELKKNALYSVPTGESIPFSFAVNKDNRELYFILNKTVVMTKREDMDSALASYMNTNPKVSLGEFLRDNWIWVLVLLTAVFATILVLLYQKMKAERTANEQQRMLEEAAKIAELKESITSLLDNMPGMTFTKDAETGVYLACNQAFAEYAHKTSPAAVTGLTDAELFDKKTADHFVEEDKVALSMDEPYIFFEDVPDAAGNQRQLQTTKLKYTNTAGKKCVLGICQDVTDMVRIQRENATTKEAYETARSTGIIYTHIAQALARGFNYLYYTNLDSEEFIEYRTEENGTLTEVRRGYHFFEECRDYITKYIYQDDQASVEKTMNRRNLVKALDQDETVILTCRMVLESGVRYVSMRISRMEDDDRFIVIGISDIDDQMRHQRAEERMKEEQIAYARLSALAGDFLCIYVVVPESGWYREFSATNQYETLMEKKEGRDFFGTVRESAKRVTYPDDLNRFLSTFTKENVMDEIERSGIFTLSYRIMIEERPTYVQLKAAMVEEKEGRRLVVGISDIDAQVRQEEQYVQNLSKARIEASIDTLTGVKNRHAYLMAEERLNEQIEQQNAPEFAVVILDVNDLKRVNDTEGHNAGDQYIRDACKVICDTFKHSPVFRIGGDEFAVIVQGNDYQSIDQLIAQVKEHNETAKQNGCVVIACGMSRYEGDDCVAPVFERADQLMYENKNDLKTEKTCESV
ncbi:MAG: transporter substrate-binding domain-containing protein [Solobacterium sp.]|nr:transporter substrate-binding domain-containing protein [Solobacterium sp.]